MKPSILAAVFLGISSFAQAAPIKVGVVLPFTPEPNHSSAAIYQGFEYAKEVFEAVHPDASVELVKYPHKNSLDTVEDAAKKVIQDKVKYVVGAEMSDEAMTLADQFKTSKVLMISPTASNPLLTAGNPLVFQAGYSDDEVASQMANYIASLKNVKSIGVLHNTSSAYSDYITNAFLEEYQRKVGIKNAPKITDFRFASDRPDFSSAVDKFKRAGVDHVIAFTLQEPIISFHQLAKKAGLSVTYVGSDGWGWSEDFLKSVPGFKGIRNDYWMESSTAPNVKKFKAGFEKKFGKKPESVNAVAYDTLLVLLEAISKTKNNLDPAEVAETLRTSTFAGGVTATNLKFNNRNALVKPFYLYEVSDSGAKFLKEMK